MQKIRLKSQKLKRFQDLKILSNCDFAQLRLTKIAETYSILKLKITRHTTGAKGNKFLQVLVASFR